MEQNEGHNRLWTDTIGDTNLHLDNEIKAKNEALELRKEVEGPMPKSNTFCAYHAEKNKTSHHKQKKSFDKSGPERSRKLAERNESYAKGKRKPEKQDGRQVSPALHDVKCVLQLASGKQSDRRIIFDSEASFHWLSSTNLTAIEEKSLSRLATPLELNTANGETPVEGGSQRFHHSLVKHRSAIPPKARRAQNLLPR